MRSLYCRQAYNNFNFYYSTSLLNFWFFLLSQKPPSHFPQSKWNFRHWCPCSFVSEHFINQILFFDETINMIQNFIIIWEARWNFLKQKKKKNHLVDANIKRKKFEVEIIKIVYRYIILAFTTWNATCCSPV